MDQQEHLQFQFLKSLHASDLSLIQNQQQIMEQSDRHIQFP